MLKDSTQTIEIYPIKGALHGEDMVVDLRSEGKGDLRGRRL